MEWYVYYMLCYHGNATVTWSTPNTLPQCSLSDRKADSEQCTEESLAVAS
jgi:hypothetical protein